MAKNPQGSPVGPRGGGKMRGAKGRVAENTDMARGYPSHARRSGGNKQPRGQTDRRG